MQNIKYHLINILAVLIFSFTTAYSFNQILRNIISPVAHFELKSSKSSHLAIKSSTIDNYNVIFERNFFPVVSGQVMGEGTPEAAASIDNLTLVGTITGPWIISRAMIQKKGEKEAGIFALYKNDFVTNDVYGYKLTAILDKKVYLTINGERRILELFGNPASEAGPAAGPNTGNYIRKNLSKSFIQQKVLNDINNATRGLLAGPYSRDGKVIGFELKKIRPYNVLYEIGLRSGDVILRINGKATDSPDKMLEMWNALKNDNQIKVDIERQNKPVTYDLHITQ